MADTPMDTIVITEIGDRCDRCETQMTLFNLFIREFIYYDHCALALVFIIY